jgi:hypothetical protein
VRPLRLQPTEQWVGVAVSEGGNQQGLLGQLDGLGPGLGGPGAGLRAGGHDPPVGHGHGVGVTAGRAPGRAEEQEWIGHRVPPGP